MHSNLAHISPGFAYVHTHHRVGYRFEPQLLTAAAADPVGEEK